MDDLILVAFNDTLAGHAAFDRALEIAKRNGWRLLIVDVAESIAVEDHSAVDRETATDRKILVGLVARAAAVSVQASFEIPEGDAALVIPELAQQRHARMIVIGHRHRSLLQRIGAMSVSKRVVDHSQCEVVIVGE